MGPPSCALSPQVGAKRKAQRKEIFKRAEQYVKEYRSQVRSPPPRSPSARIRAPRRARARPDRGGRRIQTCGPRQLAWIPRRGPAPRAP